jgi:hypothetical protein
VQGEGAVNKGNMRKWCRLFKEGRTKSAWWTKWAPVCGHGWFERKIECKIRENRRFTVSELNVHYFRRPESEKWPRN